MFRQKKEPLCLLLSVYILKFLNQLIRICRGNVASPEHGHVRKICVLHMSGIGDLLLGTPALRALGELYPNSKIDVVTYSERNAQFLLRYQKIETVIEFKLFDLNFRSLWRASFWRMLIDPILKIRKEKYDIYVSLHNAWLPQWSLFEMLICAFSKARLRVGINPSYLNGSGFFDICVSEADLEQQHYPLFYLKLIGLLGTCTKQAETFFHIDSDEKLWAGKLLRGSIPDMKGYVILHPGATTDSRRWPPDLFRQLCLKLCQAGYGIVLVGTESEMKLTNRITEGLPQEKVLNMAGKTNVFEMAALIDSSDLFIGNDSGPLHIALALKRPSIGLVIQEIPRNHRYMVDNVSILASHDSSPALKGNPFSEISVIDKSVKLEWKIMVDEVYEEAMRLLG